VCVSRQAFKDFLDKLPPMSVDTRQIFAYANGQLVKRVLEKESDEERKAQKKTREANRKKKSRIKVNRIEERKKEKKYIN
jgi:hypothetical protein